MDIYGISQAITGVVETYFNLSRATGRTTHLADNLRTGDRVVFVDVHEAKRVQRLYKDRDIDINVLVVPTRDPTQLFDRPASKGRTIFDHAWVEQFYADALADATKTIERFQTQSSGYGTAHEKTRAMFKTLHKDFPFKRC